MPPRVSPCCTMYCFPLAISVILESEAFQLVQFFACGKVASDEHCVWLILLPEAFSMGDCESQPALVMGLCCTPNPSLSTIARVHTLQGHGPAERLDSPGHFLSENPQARGFHVALMLWAQIQPSSLLNFTVPWDGLLNSASPVRCAMRVRRTGRRTAGVLLPTSCPEVAPASVVRRSA